MKNFTFIISLFAIISAGVLHPMKRPADLLEPSLITSKKIHLEFMQDVGYTPLLGSELQEECNTQEKIETERSFLEDLEDFIGSLPSNMPEIEESTSKIEKEGFFKTGESARPLLPDYNISFVYSGIEEKNTQRIIPIVAVQSTTNNIGKKFPCTFKGCGKYFLESYLPIHMRIHTGEKPYACKFCDKSFTANISLNAHIRTQHPEEKPYLCTLCNASFTENKDLKIHMHTHPHTCHFCNKSFAYNSALAKHLLTHTGEKPYPCTLCNKAFIQNGDLTRHMRTHTGEKPYVCLLCNTPFSTSSNLTTHMTVHKGLIESLPNQS